MHPNRPHHQIKISNNKGFHEELLPWSWRFAQLQTGFENLKVAGKVMISQLQSSADIPDPQGFSLLLAMLSYTNYKEFWSETTQYYYSLPSNSKEANNTVDYGLGARKAHPNEMEVLWINNNNKTPVLGDWNSACFGCCYALPKEQIHHLEVLDFQLPLNLLMIRY